MKESMKRVLHKKRPDVADNKSSQKKVDVQASQRRQAEMEANFILQTHAQALQEYKNLQMKFHKLKQHLHQLNQNGIQPGETAQQHSLNRHNTELQIRQT